MKKLLFILAVFCTILSTFSQRDQELFRINDTPVLVSEFKQVYEKNLSLVEDEKGNDLDDYLELFINYKLKVKEAYSLQLDTVKGYQEELEMYKNQLIIPYLYDKETLDELVMEAYNRTKTEIKASHILVKYPSDGIAVDTSFLKSKIDRYRSRILQGEDFAKVAREVSEDPSAKVNGGDLGYFSAFQMIYPFENVAYKTKIGEISEPFQTKFGLHIIKVTGSRLSKGKFEVAHILVTNSAKGKSKIEEIYQLLESGASFEKLANEHSDDLGSASNGGKLPRFGTGEMVEKFENEVLKLEKIGDYSKPFRTKYGWHIVKLLKNYPIASFEEMKEELTTRIKNSSRAKALSVGSIEKIKKNYKIKEYPQAFNIFKEATEVEKNGKLDKRVLSINGKEWLQKDLVMFAASKNQQVDQKLFKEFVNNKVINYFKEDLANKNSEYKNILQEYKEGLLLFDLMETKIWNKASTDEVGLNQFYSTHKNKYGKELDEIRGQVMSDYQDELEKEWIKDLREKNTIKVKEKVLRKLKKTYNQ